jgi:spoIIIJ-associated protein
MSETLPAADNLERTADADETDDGEASSIRLDIPMEDKLATAQAVCQRLFDLIGLQTPQIAVRLEDEQIVVHLDRLDPALTQPGDTRVLESVQFILNKAVNRWAAKRTRLSLDAEGFRRRRPEGLDKVAALLADKAAQLGLPIAIGPMGQGDLRFMTAHLQRARGVTVQPFAGPDKRRLLIRPVGDGGAQEGSGNARGHRRRRR